MKILTYLPHPLWVSLLAGSAQILDLQLGLFVGWVGFVSWACYFIFVPTFSLKSVGKLVACWVCGMIAAIAVIMMALHIFIGEFGLTAITAFPLALMIVAFFVICCENIQSINLIPAWFLGSACFFALHDSSSHEVSSILYELAQLCFSCLVGQVLGYLTVFGRRYYTKYLEAKS